MKRPLKNVFSLLIGDVGSRIVGFFVTVYLARVLAPASFGVINIGLSVLGYLLLLGSPGLQLLEARNTAAGADQGRVNSILSLRIILAVGLLAVTIALSFIAISSREVRDSVILFSLCLIPMSLFLDWFFQGKEQFVLLSAAKLAMNLIYGLVVVLTVRSAEDVVWVPVGFAAGTVAATALLLFGYRRFGTFSFVWQPDVWKTILRASVPVGLAMFLAQSAMNLPPIALGWFVSFTEAGVFSAAVKVVFVLLMFDRIVNALLLPAMTRYFSSRRDDVPFFLTAVVKIILVILLPLTVCGVALSQAAISAVFGSSYADAVPLLRILMAYLFLTVLNSVFVCSLIGAGKETEYTSALNIGSAILVFAIVAGAALIGSTGVAWGIVAGEFFTVVLMIHRTKMVVELSLIRTFLRPVVAAAAMVAALFLLEGQSVFLQTAVSLLVFAAAVVISKGVGTKEIQFLRERFV